MNRYEQRNLFGNVMNRLHLLLFCGCVFGLGAPNSVLAAQDETSDVAPTDSDEKSDEPSDETAETEAPAASPDGAAQAEDTEAPGEEGTDTEPAANEGDVVEAEDQSESEAAEEPNPEATPENVESAEPAPMGREQNCSDGIDDDGDSVTDCADADCFDSENCQKGGYENSNAACQDFVDNDDDGYLDCDDFDCQNDPVTVCLGSWDKPQAAATTPVDNGSAPQDTQATGDLAELIGKGTDKDGERNDLLCSDGLDNDGDGAIDCLDVGCRFDPEVTICRGTPGVRFSMVANVAQSYTVQRESNDIVGNVVDDVLNEGEMDTRFSVLQLRAFGPLPGIQKSFFLISMRTEKTPRLTFAMAQFPIWGGHFINVNSGGGGLSNALILSASKRPLVDPAFYLYSAFEQGNGAALEVNGPLWPGWIDYRVFAAGGSGLFNGNVGGRYFSYDNDNYTYSTGAQLIFSPIGYFNRWDSGYMYTSVPATLGFAFGAKYDQRAQERYPAVNVSAMLRWWHFLLMAENYTKRELEFGSWQTAYNITAGVLLWPRWLYWAADFGQFIATDMENPPDVFQTELRRQRNEMQWRTALHFYFWRNIGVFSVVFADRYLGPAVTDPEAPMTNTRSLKAVAQFRF